MKTIMVWLLVLLCTINMLAYLISMAAPFVGPVVIPYVKPLLKAAVAHAKPLWNSAEKMMPWAKTPEEIAAEAAAHEREVAENAKKEATFQKVVTAAREVRQSVRDPGALTWDGITANDDATVICMAYRTPNGRGGFKKEMAVQVSGKTSRRITTWNQHCAKNPLNDMSRVADSLN